MIAAASRGTGGNATTALRGCAEIVAAGEVGRFSWALAIGLSLSVLVSCAPLPDVVETPDEEAVTVPLPGKPVTPSPRVATGKARLSWDAPRTRTDGACLSDLAGFLVRWGTDPDRLTRARRVPVQGADCTATDRTAACGRVMRCTHMVKGLAPATWHFVVHAYDSQSRLSEPSGMVSKTVVPPRAPQSE